MGEEEDEMQIMIVKKQDRKKEEGRTVITTRSEYLKEGVRSSNKEIKSHM